MSVITVNTGKQSTKLIMNRELRIMEKIVEFLKKQAVVKGFRN